MEAVLSHAVLFIVFIGNGEHISLFGHCLMESRVKYRNLGNVLAENLGAGVDALNMSGIVQGSKGRELLDFSENVGVDENGTVEVSAALYYAVTDGGHFVKSLDSAVLGVEQSVLDRFKSLSVVLHFSLALNLFAVGSLKSDERALGADSFAVAFCKHALVSHIDELVLQGGAACIDN